jgi:hypothetical protein
MRAAASELFWVGRGVGQHTREQEHRTHKHTQTTHNTRVLRCAPRAMTSRAAAAKKALPTKTCCMRVCQRHAARSAHAQQKQARAEAYVLSTRIGAASVYAHTTIVRVCVVLRLLACHVTARIRAWRFTMPFLLCFFLFPHSPPAPPLPRALQRPPSARIVPRGAAASLTESNPPRRLCAPRARHAPPAAPLQTL